MASKKEALCEVVAEGGVGESGASTMLHHKVSGRSSVMIVLRRTESSLCPNTGAVGVLLVNGQVRDSGNITGEASSIQAEAAPGDHVIAVVHTYPEFNGISCIRLGELEVTLDVCALVGYTAGTTTTTSCSVSCAGLAISNWYAWLDTMPPRPDGFHVTGDVEVPNPGVDVELFMRVPQGINPAILQLELSATQRPGIWPQVITTKQARFDRVPAGLAYTSVDAFCGGEIIEQVTVEVVS